MSLPLVRHGQAMEAWRSFLLEKKSAVRRTFRYYGNDDQDLRPFSVYTRIFREQLARNLKRPHSHSVTPHTLHPPLALQCMFPDMATPASHASDFMMIVYS